MRQLSTWKSSSLAIVFGGGAWVVYALLSIFAPQHSNPYHLTRIQIALLQLTIIVPILLFWLVAAYGAAKFKAYSLLIRKSPDGIALAPLTTGLIFLAFASMLNGILGILPRYAIGTGALMPLVFVHNHLPLLMYLIATWYIFTGSRGLARLVHTEIPPQQRNLIIAFFAAVGVAFMWVFGTNLVHTTVNGVPNFALPGHWPLVTLAAPYLVVWVLGAFSMVNLRSYILNVKGTIYRESLVYLANGIIVAIGFAEFLQLLALSSSFLIHLALGPVLGVIYIILIFYGLGYGLIALGANKLGKIEAVK